MAAANSTQLSCGQPAACLSGSALAAVVGADAGNCTVLSNVSSSARSCWCETRPNPSSPVHSAHTIPGNVSNASPKPPLMSSCLTPQSSAETRPWLRSFPGSFGVGRCPNAPLPKAKDMVGTQDRFVWNCAAAESAASYAVAVWRAAAAAPDGAVDCWLPAAGSAWPAGGAALSMEAAAPQGDWACGADCQATERAYYTFVILSPIMVFFSLIVIAACFFCK